MYNKITLIGRLGKDPELAQTPTGKKVAKFSIATAHSKDQVDWHNIVAWEKLADITTQYLKKGSLCAIEGRLAYRQWNDKDTGKKVIIAEIIASQVVMLDQKKIEVPKTSGGEIFGDLEDIPF